MLVVRSYCDDDGEDCVCCHALVLDVRLNRNSLFFFFTPQITIVFFSFFFFLFFV